MTPDEAIEILSNVCQEYIFGKFPYCASCETDSLFSKEESKIICAFTMAENALGKHIPKKIHINAYSHTKCSCGYEFSKHYGDGYYDVPPEKMTMFCPRCGQMLKWRDEENI